MLNIITRWFKQFFSRTQTVAIETPAQSLHEGFLPACYPLFGLTQHQKLHSLPVDVMTQLNFWHAANHTESLRIHAMRVLRSLGYEVVRSIADPRDLLALYQGRGVLVRCFANGADYQQPVVKGTRVEDMQTLRQYALQCGADAAMAISISGIQPSARQYCKNNGIFGLCSYDLCRVLMKQGIFRPASGPMKPLFSSWQLST